MSIICHRLLQPDVDGERAAGVGTRRCRGRRDRRGVVVIDGVVVLDDAATADVGAGSAIGSRSRTASSSLQRRARGCPATWRLGAGLALRCRARGGQRGKRVRLFDTHDPAPARAPGPRHVAASPETSTQLACDRLAGSFDEPNHAAAARFTRSAHFPPPSHRPCARREPRAPP